MRHNHRPSEFLLLSLFLDKWAKILIELAGNWRIQHAVMKQINKAGHILLSDSGPIFNLLLFFFLCLLTYLFLKHELKGVDKGKKLDPVPRLTSITDRDRYYHGNVRRSCVRYSGETKVYFRISMKHY